jgi:hypothetical protein
MWRVASAAALVVTALGAVLYLRSTDSDAAAALNMLDGSLRPNVTLGERFIVEPGGRIRPTPLCQAPNVPIFRKTPVRYVFENAAGRYVPSVVYRALLMAGFETAESDAHLLPDAFFRRSWIAEERYVFIDGAFPAEPDCAVRRDEALARGDTVCTVEHVLVSRAPDSDGATLAFSFTSACDAHCPIQATDCKAPRSHALFRADYATRVKSRLDLIEISQQSVAASQMAEAR